MWTINKNNFDVKCCGSIDCFGQSSKMDVISNDYYNCSNRPVVGRTNSWRKWKGFWKSETALRRGREFCREFVCSWNGINGTSKMSPCTMLSSCGGDGSSHNLLSLLEPKSLKAKTVLPIRCRNISNYHGVSKHLCILYFIDLYA